MEEIEESLEELPVLVDELSDVREETIKHSQLATARENLKHIFMVPETVKQAEALVANGKLLEAHKVRKKYPFVLVVQPFQRQINIT